MKAKVFTLIALLLLLLTGCNSQQKKFVIAVSQCSDDSWRAKLNDELKTAEYVNDSLLVEIASADDNSKRQVEQIHAFIKQGVDLLIVSPNQLEAVAPAIEHAYDSGIPVILYDRKTKSKKYTAFIGCDNYLIGKSMGDFIAQRLKEQGKVVEIQGLKGSSAAIERHQGFVDALKNYPNIELVASEYADWKEEGGKQAMLNILRHTQDFQYVYAHNDRMAWGAYQEGKSHEYHYVGVDGQATEHGGLEMVRDGILDATYLYPTKGYEVIDLALCILQHQPYKRENFLQTSIVTRETAEQVLMEAKDGEQQRTNLSFLHSRVDKYVAEYNSQKVMLWGLIVFVIFMVGAIVIIFRNFLAKKILSERLAISNEELKRLNNEVLQLTHSRLMFFTNVSHELRTPLTLIADPVDQLLEDTQIKGRSLELLKLVKRNALSLQQLVNTILDFRKIQLGRMKLTLSRHDLVKLLSRWIDDFLPTAERKGITLQLRVEDYTQEVVVIDSEKLARIIYNLLSNAVKYTPKGGLVIVSLSDADAGRFSIHVKDTGKGIAEDELPKVFERFYQATGAASGTGIGLALVKSFVDLLHGEVSVTSKLGEGADFNVVIPRNTEGEIVSDGVVESTETEALLPLSSSSTEPVNTNVDKLVSNKGNAPTLLIIDDNEDVRQYERTLLEDKYFIIEAANGAEGLEKATKEVPDLVLCDVMMPVMDGLEFCDTLKSNTATSHIPIIMITAKNLEENQVEGYNHGADSYICKPFNSKVLLSRIDNLLKQRATLRNKFTATSPDFTGDDARVRYQTLVTEEREGSKDKNFLTQLRSIIRTHLADSEFGVETISQEIGLSRVQLYRKVKTMTGSSVVDLIRKARLIKARQLLAETDMNISEVAYEVGFTSPSYFTKCYKDEFGLLPSQS